MYYGQWGCLACPADLERTKGVQDVSVLWNAASHMARANRGGFKVKKWVAVLTGMAQSSFQGLLANSMSSMDFFTCGFVWQQGEIQLGHSVGLGPSSAPEAPREVPRAHGWAGRVHGPCQPWTCFPHSSQMFSWSSPDRCSCAKIPPEPPEENKSQGKASNSDTNYVRIQTSPNLTFFKVKCRTRRSLIASGL